MIFELSDGVRSDLDYAIYMLEKSDNPALFKRGERARAWLDAQPTRGEWVPVEMDENGVHIFTDDQRWPHTEGWHVYVDLANSWLTVESSNDVVTIYWPDYLAICERRTQAPEAPCISSEDLDMITDLCDVVTLNVDANDHDYQLAQAVRKWVTAQSQLQRRPEPSP